MTRGSDDEQIEQLLRFYPPRYRRARGDELADVLRELVPADGRIPWRLAVDVALGGIRFRLRDRPPALRRWAYRWGDRRLPSRWAEWVRDDIEHWSYPVRRGRFGVFTGTGAWIAPHLVARGHGSPPSFLLLLPFMMLASATFGALIGRRKIVAAARRRHGVGQPAAEAPGATFLRVWQLPARQQVWPVWLGVGVVWLTASPLIAWTLATVPPQRGDSSVDPQVGQLAPPAAGVAAGLGAVLLIAAALRIRSRLPRRELEAAPDSQWASPLRVAGAAGAALAFAAVSWLAAWADFEPGAYAIATATVGLAAGPAVVAASLLARRLERVTGVAVTSRELIAAAVGRGAITAPQPALGMVFPPRRPPVTFDQV